MQDRRGPASTLPRSPGKPGFAGEALMDRVLRSARPVRVVPAMRGGGPNCCADATAAGGGPDPVAVAPSVIAVGASVIAVSASVIAVGASVIAVGAPVEAACVIAASVIAAGSNPCERVCGSDGNRASRQHDSKYKGTRSTVHFTSLS